MNSSFPPGYRPPPVTPVPPPRPGAPPPDVHYVHGDVVEYGRRTAAQRKAQDLDATIRHLAFSLALGLATAAAAGYAGFKITRQIGWWVIIPPIFVALLVAPGLIALALLLVSAGGIRLIRLVAPAAADRTDAFLSAIGRTVVPWSLGIGTAAGYLAAVVTSIVG